MAMLTQSMSLFPVKNTCVAQFNYSSARATKTVQSKINLIIENRAHIYTKFRQVEESCKVRIISIAATYT